MWDSGEGYNLSSDVGQNRFSPGSNTFLIVSSRNSLKTPSWSIPASSSPWTFTNLTRITPFNAAVDKLANCRYPSSTIRLRWIVTRVEFPKCTLSTESVDSPNEDLSAATFRRNKITLSECGIMWGNFWIKIEADFLFLSNSDTSVDGLISLVNSQWFAGVNRLLWSLRCKTVNRPCKEENRLVLVSTIKFVHTALNKKVFKNVEMVI